ncbi:50S ribosomal protein L4 [Mycoplasma tauri]|uniref:Large ribosomal subunit protein uL4 n=1 Tax=Mycoplasma tauri TaxID=547987 RepID=A0A953ND10_9MOLU|nr:50S ribosomal protein L4 [Mycoplasma tauri]MBZ4195229.1 50S ribosomal protein L4 [Mycoplasma tauri]MBZ4203527.1 50S ribosomal protein L4 [Mycoplasma tauri]MBZ4204487.1 50S ribosomal protein L4 [Mycoplasma tauri]MBZ4218238.1 50S ribosomal protein L4 [Mycoplasma tauri]MBZ4227031.1 50S ribosomal protein L4 [Mycoplasma tauri]
MAKMEKELKASTTKKSSSTSTKSTTSKKVTKAEEKAQVAKTKTAIKKATEVSSVKKSAAQAKAEKVTSETIEKAKKDASKAKRTMSKVTTTSPKVKANASTSRTRGMQTKDFEKVIVLDFDTKSLNKTLFASEKIYSQAIFDTIISDRAAQRQGTHDVKSRAEVRGGGKKPWRQKGTGRARAGSTRSPIWVGGGRAFGPTPERNYKLKVNKKVRFNAFVSALTLLAQNKAVIVDDFKLNKISTKEAANKLASLKIENLKHILIVTNDEIIYKSVANLPNVTCVRPTSVSVENLVWADVLVLSKEGLSNFEGRIK